MQGFRSRGVLPGIAAGLILAVAPAATGDGLLALYDFWDPSGERVMDRSGVDPPLHLRITDPRAVARAAGSLEIRRGTLIRSEGPARKVSAAVRRTGEITVEAWLRPANTSQDGPARIVTISRNSSERNVTLGQEGPRLDVRFRTTKGSRNGIPSLASKNGLSESAPVHVVFTRGRNNRAMLYQNGRLVSEMDSPGTTGSWDDGLPLALGNELSGDRPWLGTVHHVAIYQRAFPRAEVVARFRQGPEASGTEPAGPARTPAGDLFEHRIAPLLAKHCLECHDSATREGRLDLSRRESALAGGTNGAVIVPGKAEESELWLAVAHDEMPEDRDPLADADKKLIADWIEAGAPWTIDLIDPADYVHGGGSRRSWVQRLTVAEYAETVRATTGVDIAEEARRILPPDLRADGFSNTAYNLTVDLAHVGAYARLAGIIVERMDVLAFAGRFSGHRRMSDKEMRALIGEMGKWVLRGPLDADEVNSYRGITTTVASAGGGFPEAVGLVLEAMLQSPRFIYRFEHQRGDGSAWPASGPELASRLSYIIWGASPDRELAKSAESGELFDRDALAEQVDRMWKDPRAVNRSVQFVSEWLDLGRLETLRPDPDRFPEWDPALAGDMRAETIAFFREIVWERRRPLTDLLDAPLTFATPRLAKHYGLHPVQPGNRPARYNLSEVPGRGGLLTQGSVLTIGGDEASTVTRGLFVMHDLLRGVVKDPPPGIDTTPVASAPGITQRTAAETRIADNACGGCHRKFEPLAFGLEKFDGIGAWHERDGFGNALREDGVILIPGEARPSPFSTAGELMSLLAASPRVGQSLTWKVVQFALGRPLGAADAPVVRSIHEEALANGGTYQAIVTALVLSDLVQMTRTEPE